MEDYDELRHQSSEHARTVWVNWNLSLPEKEWDWIEPSPDQLLSFSNQLIDHYQVTLGKRLFVEFSAKDLDSVDGFPALLANLRANNVRTGVYCEAEFDISFWEGIKGNLSQVCFRYIQGEHDIEKLTSIVNDLCDDVDIHVNLEVDLENTNTMFRMAKSFAKTTRELTINVVLPAGADLSPEDDTYRRLNGANSQVRRIAFQNRTRPRHGHRGDMIMIDGDEATVINPRDLRDQGLNRWQGWTCHAGLEQLIINNEGEIFRGWCKQGGSLGNVKDLMTTFPVSGYQCEALRCESIVDIACTKTWF